MIVEIDAMDIKDKLNNLRLVMKAKAKSKYGKGKRKQKVAVRTKSGKVVMETRTVGEGWERARASAMGQVMGTPNKLTEEQHHMVHSAFDTKKQSIIPALQKGLDEKHPGHGISNDDLIHHVKNHPDFETFYGRDTMFVNRKAKPKSKPPADKKGGSKPKKFKPDFAFKNHPDFKSFYASGTLPSPPKRIKEILDGVKLPNDAVVLPYQNGREVGFCIKRGKMNLCFAEHRTYKESVVAYYGNEEEFKSSEPEGRFYYLNYPSEKIAESSIVFHEAKGDKNVKEYIEHILGESKPAGKKKGGTKPKEKESRIIKPTKFHDLPDPATISGTIYPDNSTDSSDYIDFIENHPDNRDRDESDNFHPGLKDPKWARKAAFSNSLQRIIFPHSGNTNGDESYKKKPVVMNLKMEDVKSALNHANSLKAEEMWSAWMWFGGKKGMSKGREEKPLTLKDVESIYKPCLNFDYEKSYKMGLEGIKEPPVGKKKGGAKPKDKRTNHPAVPKNLDPNNRNTVMGDLPPLPKEKGDVKGFKEFLSKFQQDKKDIPRKLLHSMKNKFGVAENYKDHLGFWKHDKQKDAYVHPSSKPMKQPNPRDFAIKNPKDTKGGGRPSFDIYNLPPSKPASKKKGGAKKIWETYFEDIKPSKPASKKKGLKYPDGDWVTTKRRNANGDTANIKVKKKVMKI